MSQLALLCILCLSAQIGLAFPAAAYLDPGTGSMILQGILATVAAGAAFFGTYWRRVRDVFSRSSPTREKSEKL